MTPALKVIDLITTDEGRKFAPAGRMAATIIELSEKNGDCLPQDLCARGFSRDEINAHFHMAQSLADVETKLMATSPKWETK